jgi:hypothetical protein
VKNEADFSDENLTCVTHYTVQICGTLPVVIPILFIDCRLPILVIPAQAGIQGLSISIMFNSFGNF